MSTDGSPEQTDDVARRLDDALERVAHGAAVSVPSILLQRGLTVVFTAALTNGLGAAPYGLFALARRIQRFLSRIVLGFRSGLSRFLPTADQAERNALATFASLLLLGVSTVFGAGLFLTAPRLTAMAGQSEQFATLLRVFALGMPASVWLFTVTEVLRGIEAVAPLNLTLRLAFPAAQLIVGIVGAFVLGDILFVAGGVLAVMGLTGVGAAVWIVRARGFRPRLRGPDLPALRRRYLDYTIPLFLGGIATTTQRLGFYPLIAVFLTGVAGGVFSVGVLVSQLVRLPLMAINQFIPPVAAALNEQGHEEALSRLYHVTSRLVLVGVVAAAVPVVIYRETVMAAFGPTFTAYAPLLTLFILAQVAACAAGSVGILLRMTDHQRALLVTNVAITTVLAVVAIPLTIEFGLAGVVWTYLLMLTLNNGIEVAVLYRLEGLQPFTKRHSFPLLAAVPFAGIAFAARMVAPGLVGAVVGTVTGLAAFAATLKLLGFTPVERRLAGTLVERYGEFLPGR
ncbi:lipopolysaccharide biosynthesis protein [Halolamina sediminis]|uniref:lipopolysaccharide biosynthesis protein n=1 Tax=Halolamina sediminis TaxID=1480675 RepID=UPI0006B49A8C|nr:lipopolysaccharide biosynthesis protein [Halolamina sediminis]